MSHRLLQGYWKRQSPTYSDETEYMEIEPKQSRIITAIFNEHVRVKYIPICVFYDDLRKGEIRVRI